MSKKKPIEDLPYEWFLLDEYGIDWKDSKKSMNFCQNIKDQIDLDVL